MELASFSNRSKRGRPLAAARTIRGNIRQDMEMFEVQGETYITAYVSHGDQFLSLCLHNDGRFDINWGAIAEIEGETIIEGTIGGDRRIALTLPEMEAVKP